MRQFSIVLGLLGILALAYAENGWANALGVFLMIWGNNVGRGRD